MSWRVLFGGSRFIFWALAPLLLLCAVVLSVSVVHPSPMRVAVLAVVDVFVLLLVFGLYNPRRNEWALRCTAVIFVAYLAYLAAEVGERKLLPFTGSGGMDSILAAILGLIFIGGPCIKFTLTGFHGWDREQQDGDSRNPN